MCVININLNPTLPNGTFITSAQGEYKLSSSGTWIPFNIVDLNAPATPDIVILGDYDLRVKITNNLGQQSPWSNVSTFTVGNNCGDEVITLGSCDVLCMSGWVIEVNVPNGESRSLTIQKEGLATYDSAFDIMNAPCNLEEGDVHLSNGISNDILEYGPFFETTTFMFGLDAATNTQATDTTTLTVRTYIGPVGDNNPTGEAENYIRTHILNNTGTGVIHC